MFLILVMKLRGIKKEGSAGCIWVSVVSGRQPTPRRDGVSTAVPCLRPGWVGLGQDVCPSHQIKKEILSLVINNDS